MNWNFSNVYHDHEDWPTRKYQSNIAWFEDKALSFSGKISKCLVGNTYSVTDSPLQLEDKLYIFDPPSCFWTYINFA